MGSTADDEWTPGELGPIGEAVADLIADLDDQGRPASEVYAQMCHRLAATLDASGRTAGAVTAGLSVAAVNRELRETVKALIGEDAPEGKTSVTDDLLSRLSAPITPYTN